jgi:hypothetical protein
MLPLGMQHSQLFMEHSMCNGKFDFSYSQDGLKAFTILCNTYTFCLSLKVRNPDKKVNTQDP